MLSCRCRFYVTPINVRAASTSSQSSFDWPTSVNPSPFELLHLPRSCSERDVRRRYKQLSMVYHPDKQLNVKNKAEAENRFMALTAAYNLLKDGDRRRLFLRTGIGWNQAVRKYARPGDIPFDARHNPWPSSSRTYSRYDYDSFYTSNSKRHPNTIDLVSNRKTIALLGGGWFLLYLIQIFGVIPASSPSEPDKGLTAIVSPTDSNHAHASQALQKARLQAKEYSESRRRGVKREARLNELAMAREDTGHR